MFKRVVIFICAGWLSIGNAAAQNAVLADLPIADVHFHLMLFMTPQDLKARMEKNNIRWVVSAGAQGSREAGRPSTRDNEVKKQLGTSFIPAAGGSETYASEKAEGTGFYTDAQSVLRDNILKQMNDQLTDAPRVIVETYPNAQNTSVDPLRRRRLPTDAPFFRELFAMAIRHNIPLPMHMEWQSRSVEQLGSLLVAYPQGNVLLSHCGSITSADQIREFFTKHSNIYCDLGFRGMPQLTDDRARDQGRIVYWSDGMYGKANIQKDWLKLVEDFPDRFMLAIDDVHSWEQYDAVAQSLRAGVLSKLTPATAEKLAYQNALKLFRWPETGAVPANTKPP